MPFFRNDELSIHYLQRGRGEPLLFIHGLGGSGADWAFQVAALEHRFRIIVPDLPGSGHSLPPRSEYTIAGFASALWKLMDHLKIVRTNIVGFSLGGAVALEMATLRLFPEPWQRAMREHAACVLGSVPANSYLGTGLALARWAILDRLDRLESRVLLIAAENDFTPLAEKRDLAQRLNAELVVVRGSRHGTPFDSIEATNASLLALLTDQPLPPPARWVRDTPTRVQALSLNGSIAEEHALSPLLLD